MKQFNLSYAHVISYLVLLVSLTFLLRIYNEPFSLYNYFILILILFIDDYDDSSDIEDVDLSNVEPNVIIRDNANVDED